jgi:hypothetical protein
MKSLWLVAVAGAMILQAGSVSSRAALSISVTPAASVAPAVVQVRASIESDRDNRLLVITAESPEFYTSSEVSLDGQQAPPISVVEFRNLPPGQYDVTATLLGTGGKRASEVRLVIVAEGGGLRRRTR